MYIIVRVSTMSRSYTESYPSCDHPGEIGCKYTIRADYGGSVQYLERATNGVVSKNKVTISWASLFCCGKRLREGSDHKSGNRCVMYVLFDGTEENLYSEIHGM